MKKGVCYFIAIVMLILSFIFDKQIVMYVTQNRTISLDIIFTALTYVGSAMLFIALILVIYIWVEHEREYLTPLIYGVILTFIIVYLIKIGVGRIRPYEVLAIVPLVNHLSSYSFPSMHAALAFAVLAVLNKVSKLKGFWIILVLFISFSRVYVGIHYLSDVIMGGLIGYGVVHFLFKSKNRRWYKEVDVFDR